MTATAQPSLSEAPRSMADVPDPDTPESATPASALPSTEPDRSAEQHESDAVASTSERSRSSAAKRSQQPANTIALEPAVAATAPEPAATATTQSISISTNTAIGLFSALVAVVGGVLIALLAYILNTNTNQFNATVSQLSGISGEIGALNTKINTKTEPDTLNSYARILGVRCILARLQGSDTVL